MTDPMFVVTIEWINAHATPAGGWTRKQLEQIGVAWPPLHGWKRRAIGTLITQERRRVFESLGGPEKGRDGMSDEPKDYSDQGSVISSRVASSAFQHEMSESFWRDWFAGQAMQAMIRNGYYPALAENAYKIADEMLQVRKR